MLLQLTTYKDSLPVFARLCALPTCLCCKFTFRSQQTAILESGVRSCVGQVYLNSVSDLVPPVKWEGWVRCWIWMMCWPRAAIFQGCKFFWIVVAWGFGDWIDVDGRIPLTFFTALGSSLGRPALDTVCSDEPSKQSPRAKLACGTQPRFLQVSGLACTLLRSSKRLKLLAKESTTKHEQR